MSDFGKLVEAQLPSLRRYARALTRTTVDADDLVQECLLRAIDKRHLFQPGTNLRAWLFTLMHNQRVNDVRRAVREGVPVDIDENLGGGAESNALPSLVLRDLRAAMTKLPLEQREVLLLVGLEGLTYEAVADILNVPVGTIRSRLSRGREELRRLLGIVDPDAEREKAPGAPIARRRAGASPDRRISAGGNKLAEKLVA
jgi:RNA polymerase sigma-70 factor (ECF subfamily)